MKEQNRDMLEGLFASLLPYILVAAAIGITLAVAHFFPPH